MAKRGVYQKWSAIGGGRAADFETHRDEPWCIKFIAEFRFRGAIRHKL